MAWVGPSAMGPVGGSHSPARLPFLMVNAWKTSRSLWAMRTRMTHLTQKAESLDSGIKASKLGLCNFRRSHFIFLELRVLLCKMGIERYLPHAQTKSSVRCLPHKLNDTPPSAA